MNQVNANSSTAVLWVLMTISRSGDYRLPGEFQMACGNLVLRLAFLIPSRMRNRFLAGRTFYQVSSADAVGDYQGLSERKWDAMQMPTEFRGRTVLDIGCSEGFFARECARRGAVALGIDSSLGRLLTATFLSRADQLDVRYRLRVFPRLNIEDTFDYVLCLSVLHHSLTKNDVWKVLSDEAFDSDLQVLRAQLRLLRSLTAPGGKCIVEMPYEYDDPVAERPLLDPDRLGQEMMAAGFSRVDRLGSWEYNPRHAVFKDRIIYVAEV